MASEGHLSVKTSNTLARLSSTSTLFCKADTYQQRNFSKGDVTILDLDVAFLAPDLRPPRSLPHIGPTSQDSSAESPSWSRFN